jgi:hypothetical protein
MLKGKDRGEVPFIYEHQTSPCEIFHVINIMTQDIYFSSQNRAMSNNIQKLPCKTKFTLHLDVLISTWKRKNNVTNSPPNNIWQLITYTIPSPLDLLGFCHWREKNNTTRALIHLLAKRHRRLHVAIKDVCCPRNGLSVFTKIQEGLWKHIFSIGSS